MNSKGVQLELIVYKDCIKVSFHNVLKHLLVYTFPLFHLNYINVQF